MGDSHSLWRSHQTDQASFETLYDILSGQADNPVAIVCDIQLASGIPFPAVTAKLLKTETKPRLTNKDVPEWPVFKLEDGRTNTQFDRYLMADYSGAESIAGQKDAIWLADLSADTSVRSLQKGFLRETLRQTILDRLIEAGNASQRVLFGLDHQFSWPASLMALCGFDGTSWRDSLVKLNRGEYGGPALSHPKVFCSKFNTWVANSYPDQSGPFYSTVQNMREKYSLPVSSTLLSDKQSQYRRAELALKLLNKMPYSATRIGGNGAVGGQTICGMKQLAELIQSIEDRDLPVAFWPFDGLSLSDPYYQGKHVGIEIYPTLYRPAHAVRSDANDAMYSAVYCRNQDVIGEIGSQMCIDVADRKDEVFIRQEGWILGVNYL